jgi:uncharacterized protein YkwD
VHEEPKRGRLAYCCKSFGLKEMHYCTHSNIILLLILFPLIYANNIRGMNDDNNDLFGCAGINSLSDCECGLKPCNYCLKCPCYGCLSKKTYELTSQSIENNDYTSKDVIQSGKTIGNMGKITTIAGGTFIPQKMLDREGTLDPKSCPMTEQQCSLMYELHRLVNEHRRKLGLKIVKPNVILADVAQRHSCFMALTEKAAHSNTDKREFPEADKKLTDHVIRAGYQYRALGENVSAGQKSAKEVMNGWLKSVKHKDVMERYFFQNLGIGLASNLETGIMFWTQIFATPRGDGIGGDGAPNQHESTTNVVGRYDTCHLTGLVVNDGDDDDDKNTIKKMKNEK